MQGASRSWESSPQQRGTCGSNKAGGRHGEELSEMREREVDDGDEADRAQCNFSLGKTSDDS